MNKRIHIDDVMVVIPEPRDVSGKLEEYLDVAPHSKHTYDFLLKPWKWRIKFKIIILKNSNTKYDLKTFDHFTGFMNLNVMMAYFALMLCTLSSVSSKAPI